MNIELLLNQLKENNEIIKANIDSIVVEHEDKIVEHLYNDVSMHQLRSCSKILIAYAYGIIIETEIGGGILNLDTPVYPIIKNILPKIDDEKTKKIKEWTIRTLLTHTTGYSKMMMSSKQLKNVSTENLLPHIFETEIENTPNTKYVYNNVEPFLLSVIFQEVYKENISVFIAKSIFKPLDIQDFEWKNYGKYCAAATGLFLNYKDFHKIGQLLYNDGVYNQKQIIPNHWIREMKKIQIYTPDYYKPERVFPKIGAGYFTFISNDNLVFRDGSNGQYIICDNKKNLLITIMANETDMSKVTEIFKSTPIKT